MIINDLITQLISWVQSLGWLGVFIGVVLESIIIPIPSPLVPMGAGFILIPHKITIFEAIPRIMLIIGLVGAIAATLGAYIGYYIGYFGGKPFLEKYGRYIGITWREVEEFSGKWDLSSNKGNILLFVGRLIPIIPLSIVSFGAGLIKMNIKSFTIWTFIGCIPRYFILGLLGWLVGIAYEELSMLLESAETALTMIIILFIILYIIYKRYFSSRLH